MGLELQLEDVVLVNAVRLVGGAHRVAEQGQAGQGEVVLQRERRGRWGGGNLCECTKRIALQQPIGWDALLTW